MKKTVTKKTPAATTSPWAKRGYSKIHGRGLYARCDIPEGTKVIEYVGEKVSKAEADRRDEARRARQEGGADGCVYLFELNQRHDIDGDVSWNTARMINHSCDPNCEPRNLNGHIWIVALRDIPRGAELLYDYGFDFAGWREHPCRCGAVHCVGYIVKKGQRWRVRRILAAEQTTRARM